MKNISRKAELCIVVRPEDRTIDEQRRVIRIPGKRAEFFGGRYQTDDPEIIDCLHNHPYRGVKFDEITEKDEQIVKDAQRPAVPIITGPVSTGPYPDEGKKEDTAEDTGEVEAGTRPTDTTAISPELIRVIDERINSALSVIVDLLQKDTVKEEKVMSGKPTKSFKCPYCGEPFTSGFAVGKHKKVCPNRPQ